MKWFNSVQISNWKKQQSTDDCRLCKQSKGSWSSKDQLHRFINFQSPSLTLLVNIIYLKVNQHSEHILCQYSLWFQSSPEFRSRHRMCAIEKVVLKNFAILKKRPWHKCFPLNFAKFLRTPLSQNSSGRLLLYFIKQGQACLMKTILTNAILS